MTMRRATNDRVSFDTQTRSAYVVDPAVDGNVDKTLVLIDGIGQEYAEYIAHIPLEAKQRVRVRPQPESGGWRIINVASSAVETIENRVYDRIQVDLLTALEALGTRQPQADTLCWRYDGGLVMAMTNDVSGTGAPGAGAALNCINEIHAWSWNDVTKSLGTRVDSSISYGIGGTYVLAGGMAISPDGTRLAVTRPHAPASGNAQTFGTGTQAPLFVYVLNSDGSLGALLATATINDASTGFWHNVKWNAAGTLLFVSGNRGAMVSWDESTDTLGAPVYTGNIGIANGTMVRWNPITNDLLISDVSGAYPFKVLHWNGSGFDAPAVPPAGFNPSSGFNGAIWTPDGLGIIRFNNQDVASYHSWISGVVGAEVDRPDIGINTSSGNIATVGGRYYFTWITYGYPISGHKVHLVEIDAAGTMLDTPWESVTDPQPGMAGNVEMNPTSVSVGALFGESRDLEVFDLVGDAGAPALQSVPTTQVAAENVQYEADTPGDWAGTPPTTVQETLDRLAAVAAAPP